jgi:hypothetical protein
MTSAPSLGMESPEKKKMDKPAATDNISDGLSKCEIDGKAVK